MAQDLAASLSSTATTSSGVVTKTVTAVTTQAGTGGLNGRPTTSSAATKAVGGWGELGAFVWALTWGWTAIVG